MLTRLASDGVLEAAYAWLCRRRRDWPADADIWSFRHRWPEEKACLQTALRAGRYRFDNLARVTRALFQLKPNRPTVDMRRKHSRP
jgi:RNA-directed DNA polymerase